MASKDFVHQKALSSTAMCASNISFSTQWWFQGTTNSSGSSHWAAISKSRRKLRKRFFKWFIITFHPWRHSPEIPCHCQGFNCLPKTSQQGYSRLSWRVTLLLWSILKHPHWMWGPAEPPGPRASKSLCSHVDDFQFWKVIKKNENLKSILQQGRYPIAVKLWQLPANLLHVRKSNEPEVEIFSCLHYVVLPN